MVGDIIREEHIIDATDKVLGRLASEIAILLRGKHKPSFQPHIDSGDSVRVKNVKYMKLTGKKEFKKVYFRNTGYPGGIRTESLKDLINKNPEKLLKMCVRKMLPNNKLRPKLLKRLIVE